MTGSPPPDVLGSDLRSWAPVIERVAKDLGKVQYEFMPHAEYDRLLAADLSSAMRVYWREILCRSHLAAACSVIRNHRWISGLLSAYAAENLFAFAACYRGFLESAADTAHSLLPVPTFLAKVHTVIDEALRGKLSQVIIGDEVEDALIHFTYARRVGKGDIAPDTHKAKGPQEYLQSLGEEISEEASRLYDFLCGLTHPTAFSVLYYTQTTATGDKLRLVPGNDIAVMDDVMKGSQNALPLVLSRGVLPPLLILKLLNMFSMQGLHTRAMNDVSFRGLEVWQLIEQRLADRSFPMGERWDPA